ncbi:MAG: ABC transporter substrate-binding protein [Anaerolineae bacterium]|nr:ABC transporter substrate-binding protein [Anaerolineae bacterium]
MSHHTAHGQPHRPGLWVVVMLLALGLAACGGDDGSAQERFKVGILNPIELFAPSVEGFKEGMAALGYVEGQNITYEYAGPVGTFGEELTTYAQTLVERDVDLIFAITTPGALAAQSVTKTVPIIFTLVTDPVGAGFVASWPQPGGNMTGVSDANPDSRRLQILKQVLPDMQRVYLPLDTDIQAVQSALEDVRTVADPLGLELVLREVHTPDEVRQAIAEIPEDVDVIVILPDVTTNDFAVEFAAAAMARRVPFSTPSIPETDNVLLSYGVEFYPAGEQVARLAAQVLRGTSPGDLPVESLDFALMINLETAAALGIEVPTAVLSQADTILRPATQ